MKKSLLDYYKEILEKVCFDANLLNKEYPKGNSIPQSIRNTSA